MTTARQRSLAVGLAVLLVAIAAATGFWAHGVHEGLRGELAAKEDLLDQLKRSGPRRLTAARPDDIDRRDPYLPGETETIAAAQLQKRVRSVVEGAGGRVFSSQLLLKTEGDAPDRRIELQIVFEGAIETVQAALFEIETGAPFGFVDELAMQPARSEQVTDPAETGRVLRTTLTVSSYWRRPT